MIYSDLTAIIRPPFQFAIDIARELGQAIFDKVIHQISQPIIPNHAGNQYEYWIDYDAVGNVSRMKAWDLYNIIFPHLKDKNVTCTIYYANETLSEDNSALIEYIQKNLPNIILCQEKKPSRLFDRQHEFQFFP